MSTPAQVRQRVGEDLAIVPIGQALESQDDLRITAAYNETYLRLKKKGLATWALASSVPDELVPPFALMICEKLLTSYSVPEARFQRIKTDAGAGGRAAEASLSELANPEYDDTREGHNY